MLRSAATIRGWIRRSGQIILATVVLGAVHGWADHLARLPGGSPIFRILKYSNLKWWRETQLVLGRAGHLNRLKWRHSRPGQFARWEACLERPDRRWISFAADRDAWHSMKSRIVTSEGLRLGCKNCSPGSADSGTVDGAKRGGRTGKRRPSSAANAPGPASLTLPLLTPLTADPCPGLYRGPTLPTATSLPPSLPCPASLPLSPPSGQLLG